MRRRPIGWGGLRPIVQSADDHLGAYRLMRRLTVEVAGRTCNGRRMPFGVLAGAILLVALMTGCGHWRDQAMIDAGRALVPPESSVISDSDNEGAIGILSGDYQAYIYFGDAGLGPEQMVDAVAAHAEEQGWSERYRCDRPGAWIVGYSRDDYKANVRVPKPPVGDDNSIRIQRIGDGNQWPPSDCSLAG